MPLNNSEKIGVLEFGENSYSLESGYNIVGSVKTTEKYNNVTIQDPGITSRHCIIKYISKQAIQIIDLCTDTGTAINNNTIPPLIWIDIKNRSKIKIGNLIGEFKVLSGNDDSGLSNNNSSENEVDEDDLDEVPCSQEVNESKFRRTLKSSRSQSSSSSLESRKKDEIGSFSVPATQFVARTNILPDSQDDEENFYIPETQEINQSMVLEDMAQKKEVSDDTDDDDYFQFHTEDFTNTNEINRAVVEQSQNLFSCINANKEDEPNDFPNDDEDEEISKLEWNETTRKSSSLLAIQADNSLTDEKKEGRISVTPELFLTAQSTTSNKNGDRNRILDTVFFETQDIDSQSICGKPVNMLEVVQNREDSVTPDLILDDKIPTEVVDRQNSITPDINFGDDDSIVENASKNIPPRELSKTADLPLFDSKEKLNDEHENIKAAELKIDVPVDPITVQDKNEDSFKKPNLNFSKPTVQIMNSSASNPYEILTQPLYGKISLNPYDLQTQLLPCDVHPFDTSITEDEPTQIFDNEVTTKASKTSVFDPYEIETQPLNRKKTLDPYDIQTQLLPYDIQQQADTSCTEEPTQVFDYFTKPSTSKILQGTKTKEKDTNLQDKYDAETQVLPLFTADDDAEEPYTEPPTQLYPRIQDVDDTIGVFEPAINSTLIPKAKTSPSNKENALSLFPERPQFRTYMGKKDVLKHNTTITEEKSSFIELSKSIIEVDFDRESMNELCLAPTLAMDEKWDEHAAFRREKTPEIEDKPAERVSPSTPIELDTFSSQDFETPQDMYELPSKERIRMLGSQVKKIAEACNVNACSAIFPESSDDDDDNRVVFPKKGLDIEVMEFGNAHKNKALPKSKNIKKGKPKNLTKGLGLFGESSSDDSSDNDEIKEPEVAKEEIETKTSESSKEKTDSKPKVASSEKPGPSKPLSNKAKINLRKNPKTAKLFGSTTSGSEQEPEEKVNTRKKLTKKVDKVKKSTETSEKPMAVNVQVSTEEISTKKSENVEIVVKPQTKKAQEPKSNNSSEIGRRHNTRRERKIPIKYNESANESEIAALLGPSLSDLAQNQKRSSTSTNDSKDKRPKRTKKDDSKSSSTAKEDVKNSVPSLSREAKPKSDQQPKNAEIAAYDETIAKPLRRTDRKRSFEVDNNYSLYNENLAISKKRRDSKSCFTEDVKSSVPSGSRKAKTKPVQQPKTDDSAAYDETIVKPLRRTGRKRSIEEDNNSSTNESLVLSKRRATTKHHVMFSKIDSKPYEKLIKESGGVITNSATKATILLTTNQIYRTTKFLCAMAKGLFILGSQYLDVVESKKKINDPMEEHFIQDKDAEKRYKFQMRKTLSKARKQPLFMGYEIYVTPNTKPIPAELEAIIECSQATVIYLPAKPKDIGKSFAISCADDKNLWRKFKKEVPGIKIISTEGFMLSIMQYYKNFDSYILG